MKLLVSQMSEGDNPLKFNSGKDGWVREVLQQIEKQGYRVMGEMSIDLNLTKLEPDYYLRGQIGFQVQQVCARCAESFTLPIRHSFDVAMAHVSNVKLRSLELSEESEELDINFFDGNEIDLSPIVQEQFFLSIPYQSVCKSDCRGICQHCGRNLNLLSHSEHCDCNKSPQKNAFSVLEGIKV